MLSSVHGSILQQLLTTKVYRRKKLKYGERDLICRLCQPERRNSTALVM